MALESGTYLDDLVTTNPVGATDKIKFGDDHLRLIKTVLKNTFPGLAGAAWRYQTKSSTYTVIANDNMTLIEATAAVTFDLTAAATLGNQHMFIAYANGGDITVDPNGAELINGAATLTVADGDFAIVICTGAAFIAMALPQYSLVSQAEAEAGTATTSRYWTAQRVSQAIAALAPSGWLTDGGKKTAGFTAAVNNRYNCPFAANGTITGPAAASENDVLVFGLKAGISYTFDPNGLNHNGSSSTFILPAGGYTLVMTYLDATEGWA